MGATFKLYQKPSARIEVSTLPPASITPKFKRGVNLRDHGYVKVNPLRGEQAWQALCTSRRELIAYAGTIAEIMGVSIQTSVIYRRLFDHLGLILNEIGVFDAHRTFAPIPAQITVLSFDPDGFRAKVGTDDIWVAKNEWIAVHAPLVLIPRKVVFASLDEYLSVRFAHGSSHQVSVSESHLDAAETSVSPHLMETASTSSSYIYSSSELTHFPDNDRTQVADSPDERAQRADRYSSSGENSDWSVKELMEITKWSRSMANRRIRDAMEKGEVIKSSYGKYRLAGS